VGSPDKATGSERPISIRRRGRTPLMVHVYSYRSYVSSPPRPTTILFAVDPEADVSRSVAIACGVYGLSPTETRLVQHLSAGLTLTEAAARMRVQPDSARLYLKQVFAKTGVNRQANLVRLMLLSAFPIAFDNIGMPSTSSPNGGYAIPDRGASKA
jgi:DNA-binding CsgD family transcriptional regulator